MSESRRRGTVRCIGVPIWVTIVSFLNVGSWLCFVIVQKDAVLDYMTEHHYVVLESVLAVLWVVSTLPAIGTFTKWFWLLLVYFLFFGIAALAHTGLLCYVAFYHAFYLDPYSAIFIFVVNVVIDVGDFCMLWVILWFYLTLERSKGHEHLRDEEGRPLFDDDLDRGHGLKPTIVSKLLHDFDYSH